MIVLGLVLSTFVTLLVTVATIGQQQAVAATYNSSIPLIIAAPNFQGKCEDPAGLSPDNCGILAYLLTIINVLSALVGIVVVIMIAIAGIQYSAARDNPQASVAAKNKIRDALLALVGYLFIYAFLQYIVPGGVL